MHFDDWGLYPAALGTMVLSKSFNVLKAAVSHGCCRPTSRSSRPTPGSPCSAWRAGVFGAIAAGFANLFNSPGALWFTGILCVANAVLCCESPPGSRSRGRGAHVPARRAPEKTRQPLGRQSWCAVGQRHHPVLTGF